MTPVNDVEWILEDNVKPTGLVATAAMILATMTMPIPAGNAGSILCLSGQEGVCAAQSSSPAYAKPLTLAQNDFCGVTDAEARREVERLNYLLLNADCRFFDELDRATFATAPSTAVSRRC